MSWIYLILAGLFEMSGVLLINKFNQSRNWKSFILLISGFGLSFIFLSLAMKTLPMGTAYAVWTGIGASGGAILGMIFYKEPRSFMRILCIGLVLSSAVGLKLAG
ncbi:DMT family transporter [Paenibacillus rigui]|uniref:QacE family quaternary ammonium compound efflux SMR transporter n=1 Tax=Paenibacillus rigui TaxID=554312 RepID=A0A229UYB8_9BACL|nr:multidrug efflux SMR transporter [Paenibacillus rigui]OXM88373.1 QacE family quaternary ammonium compound efflux SMR transporter [Paenibacillus rigui]